MPPLTRSVKSQLIMPKKILTRKKRLIVFFFFIIFGIICSYALYRVDERLSSSQMFLVISVLVALSCGLEILAVWWENKHRPEVDIESPFEIVGKHGVVKQECSPEGTVKIGNEIWSAISFNQENLKPGIEVIIKERQGLKLYVEKTS